MTLKGTVTPPTQLKLCLVIPSLGVGGMQRVLSELAGYFVSKCGLEVHLVMYSSNPILFYHLHEQVHLHVPSFSFNKRIRIISTLRRIVYLRREIKVLSPSLVLSFGEYWNSMVLLSLLGLRYPVYISDRCSPDKSFGKFHDLLRKWLYPKATGIIAQTSIAKEFLSKQFKHKNIQILANPIRQIKLDSNKNIRENIVLTVGRLIPTKHHDILIDIFLKAGLYNWKLIIIGDDTPGYNIRKKLQDKIDYLGANERVILRGTVANVEEYYLKSKIFAFTSSSEGFPNVIGEAMSAGLPVVAFDCVAGPSDLIEHNVTGFLIPLFDSDQFLVKMKYLMTDDEFRKRMGNASERRARTYSINRIGSQYLSFLLGNGNYNSSKHCTTGC